MTPYHCTGFRLRVLVTLEGHSPRDRPRPRRADDSLQGCVDTIQAYLLAEDAIDEGEGDPNTKTIRVSYRPDMVVPEAIETAINRLGHKAKAA